MKRVLVVAGAFVAFAIVLAPRADAGPVKHWGTFPNREVRAVALRGDQLGAEPSFTAVQGRDGYVYLRGRFGLYRMLDIDGRYERVADTSQCSGWFESQGVDTRTAVPLAICDRAADIILAAATYHRHLHTPVPDWRGAFVQQGQYRLDNRFLTSIVPADGGGFWFAYGMTRGIGIGRVWPSGRTTLRRLEGFDRLSTVAATGADVYVAEEGCRFAHVRDFAVIASHVLNCVGYSRPSMVETGDSAVWVLGDRSGMVERFGRDGSHRSWYVGFVPSGVAVARNGNAYVLGRAQDPHGAGHPVIAVIAPGRKPDVRTLPMNDAGSIAIDARDRLWISVPSWHAVAVIAPKGSAN